MNFELENQETVSKGVKEKGSEEQLTRPSRPRCVYVSPELKSITKRDFGSEKEDLIFQSHSLDSPSFPNFVGGLASARAAAELLVFFPPEGKAARTAARDAAA